MAKYTKLTPKTFKEKLHAKEYDTATGARRAIGKVADWSDADKKRCHGWINEHFGVAAAVPSKPSKKKKKGKKKKAVKKASPKKAAPKKASKKKGKKKVVKAAPKKAASKKKASKKKAASKPAAAKSSKEKTMLAEIHVVGERVGTVAQAIAVLEKAKDHGADVQKGMQEATDIVTGSLTRLKRQVGSGANGAAPSSVAQSFAASKPTGLAAEIESSPSNDPPPQA